MPEGTIEVARRIPTRRLDVAGSERGWCRQGSPANRHRGVARPVEAHEQQARANQQDHGYGDLRHDQPALKAGMALDVTRALAALLHRAHQVDLRSECGEDAEIEQHADRISGTLGCFDRVLFRGYLPIMSGAA